MARLDMKKIGVVGVAGLIDIGLGEVDASRLKTNPLEQPWRPWAEIILASIGYAGYAFDMMPDLAEPLAYAMTVPAMNALYAEIKKRTAVLAAPGPQFVPAGRFAANPGPVGRSYYPGAKQALNW